MAHPALVHEWIAPSPLALWIVSVPGYSDHIFVHMALSQEWRKRAFSHPLSFLDQHGHSLSSDPAPASPEYCAFCMVGWAYLDSRRVCSSERTAALVYQNARRNCRATSQAASH